MNDAIIKQLRSLGNGKRRKIRGLEVSRDGSAYVVDGDTMSIDEAAHRLAEGGTTQRGIDYDNTIFIEQEPGLDPTSTPVKKWRCADRAGHAWLVSHVLDHKNYLWYGKVIKEGEMRKAVGPFLLDFDTVPDKPYVVGKSGCLELPPEPLPDPSKWDGGLSCPFCRQGVSSTPGRTLHVKTKHPDRVDEYRSLLDKAPVRVAVTDRDEHRDEDDVVSLTGLQCPFCGHKVSSTPGRTNHVKQKHPERLEEYRGMFNG